MAQNKAKGAKAAAGASESNEVIDVSTPQETSPAPASRPTSLANLVSQYQTSMGIQSLLGFSSSGATSNRKQKGGSAHIEIIQENPSDGATSTTKLQELRAVSGQPPAMGSILEGFQATIEPTNPPKTCTVSEKQSGKQPRSSKTSISSLINVEENASSAETVSPSPKSTETTGKRKRASPKSETGPKKSKTDTQKKNSKAEPNTKPSEEAKPATAPRTNTDPTPVTKPDAKSAKAETKKAAKSDPKGDPKKAAKSTKKTPEVVLPSQDKPSIHPTMTTEKAKTNQMSAAVPAPSFLALEEPARDLGLAGPGEDREKPSFPVIALDIPLLDPKHPKPGQAEVVVNILRLAEEKYGWSAVHPEARSAFELMDDALDDDEDGDEDEEDDDMIVQDKGGLSKKKEDGPDKKRRKQSQQAKMNRKVGKYDYEDPFIDDEELQWEEEITTTREGFFVYWGPLVDERSHQRKAHGKSKK